MTFIIKSKYDCYLGMQPRNVVPCAEWGPRENAMEFESKEKALDYNFFANLKIRHMPGKHEIIEVTRDPKDINKMIMGE